MPSIASTYKCRFTIAPSRMVRSLTILPPSATSSTHLSRRFSVSTAPASVSVLLLSLICVTFLLRILFEIIWSSSILSDLILNPAVVEISPTTSFPASHPRISIFLSQIFLWSSINMCRRPAPGSKL